MSHEQNGPYITLTAEDLKELWLEKLIHSELYLLMLLNALNNSGLEIVIENIPAFCAEWNLPVSTFYKAKASLVLKGKIDEVITGSITLTVLELVHEGEKS